MSGANIGRLCASVLPAEFERIKRVAPRLQAFLDENLPPPLNRAVTLLTLSDDEIVIAASTPVVANYLRLHQSELKQQLRETFGMRQALRFRSLPDSLLRLEHERPERTPRRVSDETVTALERGANWIEDERLRAALLSLAESLKPGGENSD